MSVKVDQDLCINCGVCYEMCAEVFGSKDDGTAIVKDEDACDDSDCCEEAAENCPVDAITIE